jgi:tetratricopeptide (TPR) repeat protein
MLETIREYAVEQLAESPDADLVRERHEDHFSAMAKAAEPQLIDASQATILDELEAEADNLRAAILRAAEDGRIEVALDTAAALWRFWQQRSHLSEGKAILEALLERPDAAPKTKIRGRAIGALGGVVYWQGDFEAALRHYNEQIAIGRVTGDPAVTADGLYNAGFAATILGDYAQGHANYEEAVRIHEALGDGLALTRTREALVFLMQQEGRYGEAREIQETNLAEYKRLGARFRIANGYSQLGVINMGDGALEASAAAFREAMALWVEAADMPSVARGLILTSILATKTGDFERAAKLRGAADEVMRPLGNIATPMQILRLEDPAIAAREALGDEGYSEAYEAGRALSLDEIAELLRA